MFLIFNKEFRQIESILSDLMTKVKKARNFIKKYDGAYEIYELDMVDIFFQIPSNIITVKDKSGKEIITLDCHYDRYDKLQDAKWNQFGGFLGAVRDAYDKRVEKAEKMKKAAKEMQKKETAKQQQQTAEAGKQKMLSDALGKLRGM